MPFCRKCGRRLSEYCEVCTDCGQSTTLPIINVKKGPGSGLNFKVTASKKITKAMIPEKASIIVKTTTPTASLAKIKPQSEIVKINIPNAPPKFVTADMKIAPITKAKPVAPPKPVLSAKHIVKPKKVTLSKPTALFTIAHARPVATFAAVEPKPIAFPKPVTQSIPVLQAKPAVQATPVATPAKHAPPLKPIPPAMVYPPHEIMKSTASLKNDFLSHPQDYETQKFGFDLKCPNDHFWPEGNALPVSNGKALCPQCGERLRKNKQTKRRRRYRYFT